MGGIFSAGHGLKYAVPGRVPPDRQLFPHYMQNAQHLWLHFTEWWPHGDGSSSNAAVAPTQALRGVVFIVPGLGEHTGRYDSVAEKLNAQGYVAFSMDNQGAGGSEGLRLYVQRFSHFVDDVLAFVRFIRARYPALEDQPTFLMGHSMGGLISTLAAQREPTLFRGVVLSGPALGLAQPVGGLLRSVGHCLSKWVPKLPVHQLNDDLVSHNQPVVELVKQDPFYSNVTLRARFTDEMLEAQDRVAASMETATFPFLIVHGEDDQLCALSKAKWFCEKAPSTDKQIVTFPGAAHEVLTELCRGEVTALVMKFISERTE